LDLVVERKVIVELKALREFPEYAYAQVLSYLRATGYQLGLLINFGEERLIDGVKRIVL